jgi:AcrR family transcriptional regulator
MNLPLGYRDLVDETMGLRQRKKAATRLALHEAALRLAVDQGFEHVTVEAIADAANVSRRTFSNYFSGKEEAFFHGDRVWLGRLLELVHARPAAESPWTVLSRAAEALVTEAYGDPDPAWLAERRQLRLHAGLVTHQVAAYTAIERDLAAELSHRLVGPDVALRSRVLAAAFLATLRAGIQCWIDQPDGRLRDAVGTALATTAPGGCQTEGAVSAPMST